MVEYKYQMKMLEGIQDVGAVPTASTISTCDDPHDDCTHWILHVSRHWIHVSDIRHSILCAYDGGETGSTGA